MDARRLDFFKKLLVARWGKTLRRTCEVALATVAAEQLDEYGVATAKDVVRIAATELNRSTQPVARLRYYLLQYYLRHGTGTLDQLKAYVWPLMKWVTQPNARRMIAKQCQYLGLPFVRGKSGRPRSK